MSKAIREYLDRFHRSRLRCRTGPLGAAFWLMMVASAAIHPVDAQEVRNTSYVAPDGSRVLRHEVVVPAGISEVWRAFTTSEGVESWAAPFARVDFRLGGVWESSYDPDATAGDPANIRNRFISYLPLRMISMQAEQAPPDFPHPEIFGELFSVVEFEEVGPDRVRVTVSGVGYRNGPAYDTVYEIFAAANAWTLDQLRRRFVDGPVDWDRALRTTPGG